MITLSKTVKKNGGGDYTDFVTAVADILVSGLNASGYYTNYVLFVDNEEYSGYFDVTVPYSGNLTINGSGTWWTPTQTSYISGYYNNSTPNIDINGFCINGENSSTIFNVYSGAAFNISNTEFLEISNGIENSGSLSLEKISANGIDAIKGNCFVFDYGNTVISNSSISNFASGIYTSNSVILNSQFIDNSTHVILPSGHISISRSLLYGGSSGIVFESIPTGELYITTTTINVPIPITVSGVLLNTNKSIIKSDNEYCIYGSVISGTLSDSCTYPSTSTIPLTETNVIHSEPKFNSAIRGDFRLKFKQTTGDDSTELYDRGLYSGVTLYTEQAQFMIKDSKGHAFDSFLPFVYKSGNSLLLSDHMKEIAFSNTKAGYTDLNYSVQMLARFTVNDVPTLPSFSKIYGQFPYDWTYKVFQTAEITNEHRYIIPKSIVDIQRVITPFISQISSVQFSAINKTAYSPIHFLDYRGVGYDYDLNSLGTSVVWMIEGTNQKLIKVNAFTGELVEEYPLFVPDISDNYYIVPSGLIYNGVYKDQHRYMFMDNPDIEILADNPDYKFKWISTELDKHKDAKGITAYKNNLYITLTEYHTQPIYNRSTIPIYSGSIGKIIMYDNNNTFKHFIANYSNSDIGPTSFVLDQENSYPTDLTIYEDGAVIVADWNIKHKLFKYKLAYDYAIMQSSYDSETAIILRENYENVDL